MMTDPIADLLTRIRNNLKTGNDKVELPASRVKAAVCRVLKEEGYIKSFKIIAKGPADIVLKIQLKENAIAGLKRISKPGLRVYTGYQDVPKVINGLGVSILSTSKGIISSRQIKKLKVGGEILCNVW